MMTETEAYQAMLAHHDQLLQGLESRIDSLQKQVGDNDIQTEQMVAEVVKYLNSEIVPHAIAEEHSIYRAARDKLGLDDLVTEMTGEHATLLSQVENLESATSKEDASKNSEKLLRLFALHVDKENSLILPALLEERSTDLAQLLGLMHDLLSASQTSAKRDEEKPRDLEALLLAIIIEQARELADSGKHDQASRTTASAWSLLERNRPDLASNITEVLHELVDWQPSEPVTLRTSRDDQSVSMELDVRSMAPAQRHSSIFAQYRSLSAGSAFILINDHDPKPLKYQFDAEYTGEFTWNYLESGPSVWRVRIGRV